MGVGEVKDNDRSIERESKKPYDWRAR